MIHFNAHHSLASCNSIACGATSADNGEALNPLGITPALSSTGRHTCFSLPPVCACHMHDIEPHMVHGGHLFHTEHGVSKDHPYCQVL